MTTTTDTDVAAILDVDLDAPVPCSLYPDCFEPAVWRAIIRHTNNGVLCYARPCCGTCWTRIQHYLVLAGATFHHVGCHQHETPVTVTWGRL